MFLNIEQLAPERKDQLLTALNELLEVRVLFRIESLLNEAERNEFRHLLDSEGQDNMLLAFLHIHVPEFNDLVEEESRAILANLKTSF